MCCGDFWIKIAQSYPDIAEVAPKVLILVCTMYKSETALSTLGQNGVNVRQNLLKNFCLQLRIFI